MKIFFSAFLLGCSLLSLNAYSLPQSDQEISDQETIVTKKKRPGDEAAVSVTTASHVPGQERELRRKSAIHETPAAPVFPEYTDSSTGSKRPALTDELALNIFNKLTGAELSAVRCVASSWNRLTQDQSLFFPITLEKRAELIQELSITEIALYLSRSMNGLEQLKEFVLSYPEHRVTSLFRIERDPQTSPKFVLGAYWNDKNIPKLLDSEGEDVQTLNAELEIWAPHSKTLFLLLSFLPNCIGYSFESLEKYVCLDRFVALTTAAPSMFWEERKFIKLGQYDKALDVYRYRQLPGLRTTPDLSHDDKTTIHYDIRKCTSDEEEYSVFYTERDNGNLEFVDKQLAKYLDYLISIEEKLKRQHGRDNGLAIIPQLQMVYDQRLEIYESASAQYSDIAFSLPDTPEYRAQKQQLFVKAAQYDEKVLELNGDPANFNSYSSVAYHYRNAALCLGNTPEKSDQNQQLLAKAALYSEKVLEVKGDLANSDDYEIAASSHRNAGNCLPNTPEYSAQKQQLFAKALQYDEKALEWRRQADEKILKFLRSRRQEGE